MDYKEAIEILQTLYPLRCRMVDGRLQGGFRDYNCDTGKAITFAISAMQELQMYKAGKLVLIPDAVHKKQCEELDEYKKLGTLEEVCKAVEKQRAKCPTYEGDGYAPDGTFVWDEWICPRCETRYEVDYDAYEYCPNCGQHIDWSEVEE